MAKKIYVMTDGSALHDKNKMGGYGFLVREIDSDKPKNRDYFIGSAYGSTGRNDDISQVEVIAVLQGLRYIKDQIDKGNIKQDMPVEIVTDSLRTKKIFEGTQFEVVEANISRWREINYLSKGMNINFNWIPAHQNNESKYFENEEMRVKLYEYNDKVDYLAKKGLKMPPEKESLMDSFNKNAKSVIKEGYVDPHPDLSKTKNIRDDNMISNIKGTMKEINKEEKNNHQEKEVSRSDKFNSRFSKMLTKSLNKKDSETEKNLENSKNKLKI